MNTIARRRGARSDSRGALASACQFVEALEARRLLAATIYVDANAGAITPTGATWATAFADLQPALALAVSGDTIRVADGTYKPTSGTDRTQTFQLKSGVSLLGGYAGFGAVNPDARNISGQASILSGDIGVIANNTDNTYHVVTGSGTDATAVLDGFTIRDGNADGSGGNVDDGAGLLIKGTSSLPSSPTVRFCTFTSNTSSAFGGGGAISVVYGNPVVSDCEFISNSAVGWGGAISGEESSLTVVRSTFTRNTASVGGGAIYISGVQSQIVACAFNGNSSIEGGAIWIATSSITPPGHALTNCTFVGNRATGSGGLGGAIYNFNGSAQIPAFKITNCTFVANTASRGGAAYHNTKAKSEFRNCILWDNVATNGIPAESQIVFLGPFTADPIVTYCDIQGGGFNGTGNINADPQFRRNPSPGLDAAWGTPDDDYGNLRLNLQPNTSPCIDAANNADVPAGVTTDIAGELRIVNVPLVHDPGAIVDMGAYERRVAARGLYVDLNSGIATRNGAGWTTAFLEVQDALAIAVPGDTIYVADGTYKPTTGTDRNATHQLVSGAMMFGSYAGFGAINPDARDFIATASILSGAIGAATAADNSYHVVTGSGVSASTILDGFTIRDGNGNGTGTANGGGGMVNSGGAALVRNCSFDNNTGTVGAGMFNRAGSATTVVNCSFTNNGADTDGGGLANHSSSAVTVTDCTFTNNSAGGSGGGAVNSTGSAATFTRCVFTGNSAPGSGDAGGAMFNFLSAPTITYCVFTRNTAGFLGGAIQNVGSSPVIRRCQFTENAITTPGFGGGIYNGSGSAPTVADCTFTRNTAGRGGAMFHESTSSPSITSCKFNGNTAIEGGAIFNSGSSPNINNCTFVGNVASIFGGAIRNVSSSNPTINNCTFADNFCVNGGGALSSSNASVTVTNSILWIIPPNDFPPVVQTGTGSTSITYSDVWNGYPGTGNISTDPLFVSNPSPGASGWGNADDDYGNVRLQRTSPCIDIGNNADVPATLLTDQDRNPRIVNIPQVNDPGAIVDMGAFERQIGVTVGSGIFDVNAALPSVRFTFDVQIDDDSLTADDLLVNFLENVSAVNVSYDPDTLTATFGLPATLPDGFYTATLPAGSVIDTAGDPLAADFSFDFFFLAGDANRDRTVNLADFNILAANFGQEPRTFGQGDFNYDGRVNLADFNILAGRFGTVLSADGVMRTSDERFSVLPSAARFSDRSIGAAASATSLFDDSEDEVLNLS